MKRDNESTHRKLHKSFVHDHMLCFATQIRWVECEESTGDSMSCCHSYTKFCVDASSLPANFTDDNNFCWQFQLLKMQTATRRPKTKVNKLLRHAWFLKCSCTDSAAVGSSWESLKGEPWLRVQNFRCLRSSSSLHICSTGKSSKGHQRFTARFITDAFSFFLSPSHLLVAFPAFLLTPTQISHLIGFQSSANGN